MSFWQSCKAAKLQSCRKHEQKKETKLYLKYDNFGFEYRLAYQQQQLCVNMRVAVRPAARKTNKKKHIPEIFVHFIFLYLLAVSSLQC